MYLFCPSSRGAFGLIRLVISASVNFFSFCRLVSAHCVFHGHDFCDRLDDGQWVSFFIDAAGFDCSLAWLYFFFLVPAFGLHPACPLSRQAAPFGGSLVAFWLRQVKAAEWIEVNSLAIKEATPAVGS